MNRGFHENQYLRSQLRWKITDQDQQKVHELRNTGESVNNKPRSSPVPWLESEYDNWNLYMSHFFSLFGCLLCFFLIHNKSLIRQLSCHSLFVFPLPVRKHSVLQTSQPRIRCLYYIRILFYWETGLIISSNSPNHWQKQIQDNIMVDVIIPCCLTGSCWYSWSGYPEGSKYKGYWKGCLVFCFFFQAIGPMAWWRSAL